MGSIDDVISRLAAVLPPGEGADLQGFEIDATMFSGRQRLFEVVRVIRSGELSELVRILVVLNRRARSVAAVSNALLTAWSQSCYTHFQASTVESFREAMRFRFVTVPAEEAYFVSGTALVIGPRYEELAADDSWGVLAAFRGNLPSWVHEALGEIRWRAEP